MTRLVEEAPLPRHPISLVAQLDHPRETKSLPPRGATGTPTPVTFENFAVSGNEITRG
jgi:hypothetical protein